jgi:small subunit ribosomal protein S6
MDIKPEEFKRNYETTFIITPELAEAESKKTVDRFVKMIQEDGGEIINIERWGVRKLAYPIERKSSGYYALVEFTAFGTFIEKLEKEFKYDETILRYLTVKLEKHGVEYNNKRRELGFGMRSKLAN